MVGNWAYVDFNKLRIAIVSGSSVSEDSIIFSFSINRALESSSEVSSSVVSSMTIFCRYIVVFIVLDSIALMSSKSGKLKATLAYG